MGPRAVYGYEGLGGTKTVDADRADVVMPAVLAYRRVWVQGRIDQASIRHHISHTTVITKDWYGDVPSRLSISCLSK